MKMAKANSSSFNSVSKYFILLSFFSVIKPCMLAKTKLIYVVSAGLFIGSSYIVSPFSCTRFVICFVSSFVVLFKSVFLVEVGDGVGKVL